MKRRTALSTLPLATGSLLLPGHKFLNAIFALNPHGMHTLRNNIGLYTERGGTIGWLTTGEETIVIDAQFPEQAAHFIEELREQDSSPVTWLINTHHHHDHTSGNIAFRGIAQHVLAHENSLKNQKNAAGDKTEDQLFPDVTFTDTKQLKAGSETIDLSYWGAAHTDGDSIIHFTKGNIAHIGDLVFNRRYPYIDKGAGASIENWISILDRLCTHFDDETIFIFGHAREGFPVHGDKEPLRAFRGYLSNLLEHVGRQIRDGVPEAEIMQAQEIPGAQEWQGEGIERSLKAAFAEINTRK